MTIQLNIAEKNTNTFKINKPVLLGTYRSDVSPVSNEKIKELYLRYKPRSHRSPIELERGFERYLKNKKYQINNRFENLLEWLKSNKHLLQPDIQLNNNIPSDHSLNTDFVASPGLLSLLLKCPYELENEFTLLAEKLNGIIYIKMKKRHQKNFHDFDLANYCEQKFRELHTEKINDDDFEASKLNQWISFSKRTSEKEDKMVEKITFVFRSKIKKHTVVFAEEIDCFEEANLMDKDQFGIVKFRLSRKPIHEQRNDYHYSIRMLRFWSQCVLCCVKRLVVGYWQSNHVVDEVKTYSLNEMRCPSIWSENVCYNNLNQTLSFIKNGFIRLDTNSISLIHHKHSRELICVDSNLKVLPTFYKIDSFDSKSNVLPTFYKMSLV